jgi:ribosomal protein RSM22 (predicted rRNA methylase)
VLTARLPPSLDDRLAQLRDGSAAQTAAAAALTERYRSGRSEAPLARTRSDVLAYATARLPATYAALRTALGELALRAPSLRPRSMLDLGSGPGTAVWAACDTWDGIDRATAVEAEPEMAALAAELGAPVPVDAVEGLLPAALPAGGHDLVTIGYLLGEMHEAAGRATLEAAWAATGGTLVVVEPGTPDGYRRVLAARRLLLELGARIAAPCPHEAGCPLADAAGEWCHFAVRLPRSREHRAVKGASAAYEDEKLSYVACTREGAQPAADRVLRHPQVRSGHVSLDLCTADGRVAVTVSKRDGDRYRDARKADWGGSLDSPRDAESG